MWRKRLLTTVALLTLFATACTSALGSAQLPGLQVLREETGLTEPIVSGPLRALADRAEAAAPLLDVVQIEYNDEGNVLVFAILNVPAQGEQSDEEYAAARFDAIRVAIEALGHVDHKPLEERHTLTRDDLLNRMGVALGGRAAEEEVFGVAMTGAANDLERIRGLLRTLAVTGMLSRLGAGSDVSKEMSDEMEAIYREQLERTREALRVNREVLDRIVAVLMEKEEIGFQEVQAIFAECGCKLPAQHALPVRETVPVT